MEPDIQQSEPAQSPPPRRVAYQAWLIAATVQCLAALIVLPLFIVLEETMATAWAVLHLSPLVVCAFARNPAMPVRWGAVQLIPSLTSLGFGLTQWHSHFWGPLGPWSGMGKPSGEDLEWLFAGGAILHVLFVFYLWTVVTLLEDVSRSNAQRSSVRLEPEGDRG